jgi:hypothetical protein
MVYVSRTLEDFKSSFIICFVRLETEKFIEVYKLKMDIESRWQLLPVPRPLIGFKTE